MSSDLDQLAQKMQQEILEQLRQQYSETIVEHWMNPRNVGVMHAPSGHARITGPCGDTMEIFIRVEDDTIVTASFLTDGCVTTLVSASMAVELATNSPVARALSISQQTILDALDGLPEESEHCALLASDTLRAAIRDFLKRRREPWKYAYRHG